MQINSRLEHLPKQILHLRAGEFLTPLIALTDHFVRGPSTKGITKYAVPRALKLRSTFKITGDLEM